MIVLWSFCYYCRNKNQCKSHKKETKLPAAVVVVAAAVAAVVTVVAVAAAVAATHVVVAAAAAAHVADVVAVATVAGATTSVSGPVSVTVDSALATVWNGPVARLAAVAQFAWAVCDGAVGGHRPPSAVQSKNGIPYT